MADVTGTVRATLGQNEYTLRLTMRGLATLQGEFGADLGGLLSGKVAEGAIPDFNIMLRVVEIALAKGMPDMTADRVRDVADDLVTDDQTILERIMQAAFPDVAAAAGNVKRPKRAA
jgi:hypothetical protein